MNTNQTYIPIKIGDAEFKKPRFNLMLIDRDTSKYADMDINEDVLKDAEIFFWFMNELFACLEHKAKEMKRSLN